MNICMAGIDHSLAGIDIREKFSFTKSRCQELYDSLRQQRGVLGAVLLCTCNRTEVYLSCAEGHAPDPFLLLCAAMGEDAAQYVQLHRCRRGREVFWHLCRLACGAKSQIWGEDQIITQVKNAQAHARACGAIDSYLEVTFRTAIAAAKDIKTQVRFSRAVDSVAVQTLTAIKSFGQPVEEVLVIGNGEVGKLVARALIDSGYRVSMTLRQYKYSQVELPSGAQAFDYSQRYEQMPRFDAVVSATSSPHHTIKLEGFTQLQRQPALLIDLAVPRDIQRSIGQLPGITLYNVDTLSGQDIAADHRRQLEEIDRLIEKHYADLQKWRRYREEVVAQ